MTRVVADLGNSRLKVAALTEVGTLARTVALPVDEPGRWPATLDAWVLSETPSSWTIASVNPPLLDRLLGLLTRSGRVTTKVIRSAADVPVRHALDRPAATGADRALAVLAAIRRQPAGAPGRVVSCGTALTVETITASGRWRGGAIGPGLGLAAQALNQQTAQLPLICPARGEPPAWGASTEPAMRAGLVWGAVGAIREVLSRQRDPGEPEPWVVWTGGDAPLLAPLLSGAGAVIAPDLVLEGLAELALARTGRP